PAFVGAVARLAQFVADVIKAERLVVAFDGEDLAQHAFQPVRLALFGRHVELQKTVVRTRLHIGQVRDVEGVAEVAEVTRQRWLDNALGRDGHGSRSWRKRANAVAAGTPARRKRGGNRLWQAWQYRKLGQLGFSANESAWRR